MPKYQSFNFKVSKKRLIALFSIIIIFSFISLYKLPYYIYTPGKAADLEEIVKVENGYASEGSIHLLTVGGRPATPLLFAIAKIMPHHDIIPSKEARPHGISDEDYLKSQLSLMENSQEAALVVAYDTANADIDITYNGVYVLGVIEGMPASKVLEVGDLITKINNQEISEAKDLMTYIESLDEKNEIEINFERENKTYKKKVELEKFPNEDKVGMGIQLITNREVEVNPDVKFSSGNIGGPSAGLMFALSIYNQLSEDDFTSGLKIAGSGQLDYEGKVLPIGGIDKKVIAADKKSIDILFAPAIQTNGISNYDEAKETANEIKSDIEIVPVETFQDVLDYLKTVAK